MADRLAALLEHFAVTARVFHTGTLCGIHDLPAAAEGAEGAGQLHLVRRGPLEVRHGGTTAARIAAPSLLLYPRPFAHRFVSDAQQGADLACANLHFAGGAANPLAAALPAFVCLPLDALPGSAAVLDLLFAEAFAQHCGRVAMLNNLFQIVLIQVLRTLMESGQVELGMLAGLGDARLRHALIAMHEQPARDWHLDELAQLAGMSRSVFANNFRQRVGSTPGAYLQRWRVSLAQRALQQGVPLKRVAIEVGYGSEAALSRAFKACTGASPREWLRETTQP
ncbi:AraC family transcriptional regulator [Viridibacterium curvum]|uniref:AraC family transcriptional regulator n=1 Tax=Viridibacterium curvum TaxID=1101404 RepID=A0ABP9QUH8_9RHOO